MEVIKKRVLVNCFHRQELRFFPRRLFWKAEQTQIEFGELEELLVGKKKALSGGGMNSLIPSKGILPVNKPSNKTSFSLVHALRKITRIKKIGHAGTLDPFADGVMILLIGREFTRQSGTFLNQDKEYTATLHLGIETTTFDPEGEITAQNATIPTLSQIKDALTYFQGQTSQIPPMFSAKKVQGKKLYELARKGIEIERKPIQVTLQTELISYDYPNLILHITCSKGTYIRTIANDLGKLLTCGAHLKKLTRTRCGPYHLKDCIDGKRLFA
ncbi:MAG: tRNA pseudouridine synthase B [Chlamydiae bacterium]|nr:tRNA pseudouridine synthase B [Chlamydiota bacterium]